MKTIFPATTTFPEWFHNWSEGGKLCFLAQNNFPPATFAFELGEAYTKRKQYFQFSLKINGHVLLNSRADHISFAPRHVALFNLGRIFTSEDWRWLQKFMVLDWNDVEIQVTCEAPDIHVVKCGVYVHKQITNMEDIRFKSPTMLSMDDTRTSLKRKAIASPPYEPPTKKVLKRNSKVADKGKNNNSKKCSRCVRFLSLIYQMILMAVLRYLLIIINYCSLFVYYTL